MPECNIGIVMGTLIKEEFFKTKTWCGILKEQEAKTKNTWVESSDVPMCYDECKRRVMEGKDGSYDGEFGT